MAVETVVERTVAAQPAPKPIAFTLNGTAVTGRSDERLIEAAKRHGIEVPHLCYKEGMRADGNCRTCMVEIKGERVLAPSCCRYPTDGMEVTTNSARAVSSQKMVLELLLSDIPETSYTLDSELDRWARKLAVGKPRFSARPQPVPDARTRDRGEPRRLHPMRPLRARLSRRTGNDVIGYASRIALEDRSTSTIRWAIHLVACGECVRRVDRGAHARSRGREDRRRQPWSRCVPTAAWAPAHLPHQGEQDSLRAGKDGPANSSRLCVKGRYGFDYVSTSIA